ncbi:class I SAM-dependent methyltransferase [Roseibium aggregatum]|uniref:tRNA (Cmo5U34)-methyltransferase n=1 Tax=Roseibium aggregatum TaxID=187304 RepID=A0A0M6Y7P2_9HYPH|nr:class I SAM-dependent methyltransferase [Roseibium aggregatum]CTQ45734.1 tRNA (cmo5U34)-methyltransferase [Roseibium aggregatum]
MTTKSAKVGSWSFERTSIAEEFDAHVRRHLPWYDLLSDKVADIAAGYLPANGALLDCGCSTADLAIRMQDVFKSRDASYVGVDVSEEMVEIATERLDSDEYRINFQLEAVDVFEELSRKPEAYDVIVANLFIMFLPPEDRRFFISKSVSALKRGGILIVVDRIEPEGGYLSSVLSRSTMADKMRAGTPLEEIAAKEVSLIGVQRPTNPNIYSGFKQFFQFGDFVGYVLENNY